MIRYAISDPRTLRFDRLKKDLGRFAARGATMVLYRDKTNPSYAQNAERFVTEMRRLTSARALLHTDEALAARLGADGVHYPSAQLERIPRARALGLYTVASTHTLEEALRAQSLGVDAVTLSPLFPSPGKGPALGVERFCEIVENLEIPVIALGGILDKKSVTRALATGAAGFASIRYFG
ncbi:thiamine phosphate synthase [Nitratifractor sp.]